MNKTWGGFRPIEVDNVSEAWRQAFGQVMESGYVSPQMVIIWVRENSLFEGSDDPFIKQKLDMALAAHRSSSISTVASTIFPMSLWNPQESRQLLFDRFLRIWHRVKKCRANRHGHYFHRMINFGSCAEENCGFNQLDHVIAAYTGGNHRRSALQIAIMDPKVDHSNEPIRGFPCLQHVILTPHPSSGELDITGMYANQYIFEKAYGNYLGLYNLGKFMAHEMGLKLSRVICNASCAQLGDGVSKKQLTNLATEMNNYKQGG